MAERGGGGESGADARPPVTGAARRGRRGSPEDAGKGVVAGLAQAVETSLWQRDGNTQSALEVTPGHSVLSDFQSVLSLLT